MAKRSKKKTSDTTVKTFVPPKKMGLEIEWFVPEEIETRSVSNMLLQADEHDVYMSFFDTAPPIVASMDQVEEYVKSGKKLRARCVVRIAISKTRFPTFVKAILSAGGIAVNEPEAEDDSK